MTRRGKKPGGNRAAPGPRAESGGPRRPGSHGANDPSHAESADSPVWLSRSDDGSWRIRIKAVPGASRDEIAGVLGDRLKIRVSAAPEGGKANKAICTLIAKKLGVPTRVVRIISGPGIATKTLHVDECKLQQQSIRRLIAES